VRVSLREHISALTFDSLKDTLHLLPRSPALLEPLTAAYLADLRAYRPSLPPEQRTTPALELAHLASLRPLDLASVRRVSASRILADPLSARLARARTVALRPGWSAFLSHARERYPDWRTAVVSVNWSRAFIGVAAGLASNDADAVDVLANETTEAGEIEGELHGAPDKTRVLIDLVRRLRPRRSVYVGDGEADLGCLLEADVGVVMGEAPALRATCARIGVRIEDWPAAVPRINGETLLGVKDWHEAWGVVQAVDVAI
jgi:phosphoserine phosphatase